MAWGKSGITSHCLNVKVWVDEVHHSAFEELRIELVEGLSEAFILHLSDKFDFSWSASD